jgi:alkylation response protein AidB-like acyl-CoA dehydrogenase
MRSDAVDLTRSVEQRDLGRVLRDVVTASRSVDAARAALDSGDAYRPTVWRQLVDLGVLDLLSDDLAAPGARLRTLVVVAEELGRGLVCAPFLPVAGLVAGLLAQGARSDPAGPAQRLLERIGTDGPVATLAWQPPSGRWDGGPEAACRGEFDPRTGWTLEGSAEFVLFGAEAELVLVTAATAEGTAVLAVAGDAPGLVKEPLRTVDATRPRARLRFSGVAADLVVPPDAGPALDAGLDRAAVLLAAEQLGTSERALEMTVAYARERVQFGRPIGAFQAVKHLCADMYVGVESLRSTVRAAAWSADSGAADRAALASTAQAIGSTVAAEVTDAAMHVHGGIGFTWEHPVHLFVRRGLSDADLLGRADHHLAHLADRVQL